MHQQRSYSIPPALCFRSRRRITIFSVPCTGKLLFFAATDFRWQVKCIPSGLLGIHLTCLSQVKPGWNIPLNAVMVSLVITICLSMINIGSTVAFNAIASLGVASLLSSYIISFSCLILKRYRGESLPHARWSLGKHGMWINIVSVMFLLLLFVMSFFPLATPVELTTMNWNVVIYCSAIIFAIGFYFIRGKNAYAGPVVLVKQYWKNKTLRFLSSFPGFLCIPFFCFFLKGVAKGAFWERDRECRKPQRFPTGGFFMYVQLT